MLAGVYRPWRRRRWTGTLADRNQDRSTTTQVTISYFATEIHSLLAKIEYERCYSLGGSAVGCAPRMTRTQHGSKMIFYG